MEFYLTSTDEDNLEEYCKVIEDAGYPLRKVPRERKYVWQRKFDYYVSIDTIDQLMDIIEATEKCDKHWTGQVVISGGYIEIYDDWRE